MKKYFKIFLFFFIFIAAFFSINSSASALVDLKSYKFNSLEEVWTGLNLDEFYASLSPISEFTDEKGNYYVAYDGTQKFYIAKLKKSTMKLQKTITIKKPDRYKANLLGGVIMDKQGYFYAIFGRADKGEKGKEITFSVIQYDADGKKVKELNIKGGDLRQYEGDSYDNGIRLPFEFGNADMAINGDLLAIIFAGQRYDDHQSNFVVYVKIPSLKRIPFIKIPFTGHSFDQRVITTSNNDFLFVDQGDANPRGFHIQKVSKNNLEDIKYVPFHFSVGTDRESGYNITFASLGGIGEVSTGYVLSGASEKKLSLAPLKVNNYGEHSEPRNVFVQIFKKDFENYPDSKKQIIDAPVRKATGKYDQSKAKYGLYTKPNTKDYGIKWITNYHDKNLAANVKVVTTKEDRIVILWEKYKRTGKSYYENYKYISTYYTILNNKGKTITKSTELKNVRLTPNEDPVYDGKYVYWTTPVSGKKQLNTYRLNVSPLTQDEINHLKSNNVKKLINKISEKKNTFEADIKAARNAYNQLNAPQKKLVTNYKTLTDAEKRLTVLKRSAPTLTVKKVSNKDTVIKGKTKKNITVKAYKNNVVIGSAKSDSKGNFTIKIKKQKAGTTVKVLAIGYAGITTSKSIKVSDKIPPKKPTVSTVKASSTKISGKTEKEAVVYVYRGKTLLGKATANSKGAYSIKINKQKKGTKLKVYAKDKAGNKSTTVTITVK